MPRLAPEKRLLEVLGVIQRRRWALYLGVAATATAALVGSFLLTPLYRATATLQIERQTPQILNFRDLGSVDYSFAAYGDFYQTQYKLLASDAVARRVVDRLHLLGHPEFEVESRERGLRARLLGLLPRKAGTAAPAEPADGAAKRLQARLKVTPIWNSHLVMVNFTAADPELAARVANAVAEEYIAFNIEASYNASDQASEFLVTQIATLKTEIAELERRLQVYGEGKRIVSIDDTNNITLKALSDIASTRTEAETVLAQKEAAHKAALSTPAAAMPEVAGSDLIARLKQERAAYEAEYSEKARLFKEEWPGLQTLKSKLDQAESRLAQETEAIAQSVRLGAESDYRKALEEVRSLDALLVRQEEAAQRLKRDAVEFANLQSEVQKKRETLGALIERQNQMALSTRLRDLDTTSSNVRIVDRARPPASPFRPNIPRNLAFGLFLGLLAGIGLAFGLEYLDDTLTSASDVERASGLTVLAVIPHHGIAPHAVPAARRPVAPAVAGSVDLAAHRDLRAAVSEAYRELRTALLLSSAGHPPRTILVTSALPEEGKSATAANLAVVLAQLGRRVLLVDADLRRPRLHGIFGKDNGRGMSTYLSGLEENLVSLIVSSEVPGLDLLSSGPIPPNPSELLNSPQFAALGAEAVSGVYDHVIFDAPPVLSVADPVIIGSVVEASLLVARSGRTPRESVRLAVEKFGQARIRPVGVVLNDADPRSHGYGSYRYYGRDGAQESSSPSHAQGRASGRSGRRGAASA